MQMEKMLVVVFDSESKAYEASRALVQLDVEGSIAIHAESVIKKNDDGTVTVEKVDGDFPVRTVGGTAIGSLIGLLGGPVGFGVGAAAGALAGSIADLHVAGVGAEFLDQVTAALAPGKCAVLADISEEWVTPIDTRMEPLGGSVFRTPKKSFEDEQRARDVAALRAEIDELKAEHARARADQKAKIQARIDELTAKLQGKFDEGKLRSDQIKSEAEAKVKALQMKAQNSQVEMKATLEARVAQIRENYEQTQGKLKHLVAEQLKQAAARLEK
jgi:uncharacterized membrane protein